MKKILITAVIVVVAAVFVYAGTSNAQFGGAGNFGNAAEKASRGNVGGAANSAVRGVANTENNECKGKIGPYHRNVEHNVTNGGPNRIKSAFGPCKVSNNSPTYWAAKCDYKKFNYINASCNRTNCSLYCYKK